MLKVGDRVMLIMREQNHTPDWPPYGAVGEIARGLDKDKDYEILFPEHIWGLADPTWEVPWSWVIKLPGVGADAITQDAELAV